MARIPGKMCAMNLDNIDVEKLPDSPEFLKKFISDLMSETALYKQKYWRVLEEWRLSKQRLFSFSSEKNPLQPDLFDEAGVELPEAVRETLDEEEIEVRGHVRKRKAPRRLLPPDLPREVILHDIPEEEKQCTCGHVLERIGEEVTEQLKFIPASISVIQHVRPKYACRPCQEGVRIAPMPVLLLPKTMATPELVAHTIVSKYIDHLPLHRQESIWERTGIALPKSSLCGWVIKTAELCRPLVDLLQKDIVSCGYTQADETTLQVLQEVGRANTTKSYMWVYLGWSEKPSVVFEYQETRAGLHAREFLQGFSGYLQTDAYSGYSWVENEKNIVSAGCMAHARRPFAELAKLTKNSGLAADALKFFRKLYVIEKEARENSLSSEIRHQLRLEKAPPVLEAFRKWLDHNLTKSSDQGKIGKSIRYCITHWENLTCYLKDGSIEIDNNRVENLIRPFAVGRKNWMFAGSPAGAKAGAILYSLIATCRANGIDPWQYFVRMLHEIRLCTSEDDYQKLLPQNICLS